MLYPLMQGWDSVELVADVEIGGTEQLFNLMVGRELQRQEGQRPQICVTTPVVEGLDGLFHLGLGDQTGDADVGGGYHLDVDAGAIEDLKHPGGISRGVLHTRSDDADLSQACIHLACAPKSNSSMGYFEALRAVENGQPDEVPGHLKDASRDRKGLGHGKGYRYPHAFREHWVKQQYLPDALQGLYFYRPGELGFEREVKERLEKLRSRKEE